MNTFKIKPIHNSVICAAPCPFPTDKARITRILNSGMNESYDWCYKSLRAHLTKLEKNTRQNKLNIVYSRDKEVKEMCNIERANALNSVSAGDLSNYARAGIWGDTSYDVDMCCAHPALLLSAVKDSELAMYKTTKEYVTNKGAFRQELADAAFEGDLDKAKQCLAALSYGSSLKKAFEGGTTISDKAVRLKDEMARFANRIAEENPEYYGVVEKQVKKKNTKKLKAYMKKHGVSESEAKAKCVLTSPLTSMMSEWTRNSEAIVMECVIRFCIEEGAIQQRAFDNSKDGFLVPKTDLDAYLTVKNTTHDGFLQTLTREVETKTGFQIEFAFKCMQEKHMQFWKEIEKLEQPSVFPEAQTKRFDIDFMQSLDTYQEKKEYFELFFAYIQQTKCFVYISTVREKTADGQEQLNKDFIYYTTTQQLTTAWGYLDSNIYVKTMRGEQNIPFVQEWVSDAKRRTFVGMGFTPYAGVHDPKRGSVDEFNCFRGYPQAIWGKPVDISDEDMFTHLELFFKMQAHLVGEQGYDRTTGNLLHPIRSFEDLKHYPSLNLWLHILGHRIARPHETRKPYVPVITGPQGTGKNLTLDHCIAKTCGDEHYRCSSDIEDFLGTHANALCGRLLAVFNEATVKATGKYKEKLKGLATDEKAMCNEKNLPIFQFNLHALLIILSNNSCPVQLEMNSNRRYIVFKCTSWSTERLTQKRWKDIADRYSDTRFLRILRAFFQRLDYDALDFAAAKRHNASLSPYKNMLQHFFPPRPALLQTVHRDRTVRPREVWERQFQKIL